MGCPWGVKLNVFRNTVIEMCVCVCVCVCARDETDWFNENTVFDVWKPEKNARLKPEK
jgi:hypothetical protein